MNQKIALTRDLLYRTLDTLWQERPDSSITVKDLCNKAGINRSTFYVYYDSMESFLKDAEEEKIHQLIDILEKYPYDRNYKRFILENTFSLFEEDEVLCSCILGPRSTGHGWEVLCSYAEKRYLPIWSSQSGFSKEECKYLITYICSGGYGFLKLWYQNRSEISSRDCKRLFKTFVNQSLQMVHQT